MAPDLLRVAIVSASLTRSKHIVALLGEASGPARIDTVTTLDELAMAASMPDVVILDGPDAESLESLVQSGSPPMPAVVLSDDPDRDSAVRALAAGSMAILGRDPTADQLVAAVHVVASGLVGLSLGHLDALLASPRQSRVPRPSDWIGPPTPRQLQVLRMLADGVPNKQIAAQLHISEHTAKFHVGQILAKLGAESRTEAVAIGIRHGLVMV